MSKIFEFFISKYLSPIFKKRLIFIALLICNSCTDQTLELKATQAETFFSKGNIKEAKFLYLELIDSGIKNATIFERLADSSEDKSEKVYYLRKALSYGCQSCNEKLENIRTEIKFSPIIKKQRLFSENTHSIIMITSSIIFAATIISFNFVNLSIFLILLIPSSLLFTWIGLATYCGVDSIREIESCVIKSQRNDQKDAIISADQSYALSSAENDAQAVMSLPKGAEIISNKIKGDWAQLLLPNKRTGWIMTKNLKFID